VHNSLLGESYRITRCYGKSYAHNSLLGEKLWLSKRETGARRSCGYRETYAGCKHNCTCKLQILAVTCNHQKMHAQFTP
jgi:hypothetical protein